MTKEESGSLHNFIDEKKIWKLLESAEKATAEKAKAILKDAREIDFKGLDLASAAVLLKNTDHSIDEEIFAAAREIKNRVYGNRIVLFTPLYVTNKCKNRCAYCGFNAENHELKRKTLSMSELAEEVKIIEDMGHKRILLVYGETDYKPEWLTDVKLVIFDIGLVLCVKS